MTSNPFEPPRTTDLDGGGAAAKGPLTLPEGALQELAAAAPWVRRLARLTSLSIAIGLVRAVADLVTSKQAATRMTTLLTFAVGTMVSTLFLVVLRRYASASERLRAGAPEAGGQIIDAQRSYFRLTGIVLTVGIGLFLLVFVVGYAIGRLGFLT